MVKKTLLILCAVLLTGCVRLALHSVLEPTMANLERQTDLDLVCEGTPAFLLLIDTLIASRPDDAALLQTGTQAFVSYALALEECGRPERAALLSEKSRQYGLALLDSLPPVAAGRAQPMPVFHKALASITGKGKAETLFWGGYGWATWLGFQQGAPAALLDLYRVEQIMLRVVELDESVSHGGAHLFLGAYYGSRPAMLGGAPDKSRSHFQRALELGDHQFLLAQVLYAETYARTTFDRPLFEKLLKEVLAFPIDQRPDLALSNQTAKRRARRLLEQVDTYF